MIAVALRDVEARGASDAALERELGSPEEYARVLVPKPRAKRAGPILIGGVVGALAWVALVFIAVPLGWWTLREDLEVLRMWPALIVLTLGVVGQFVSDHLRRA
ncbi:hypothetical protein EQW78_11340 [Oerskovia turbata]|uniref:Uncharacterized protein n=1 Tax=Oerskovia turbata TaxID=1713 RepID=A0A4Q1KUG0_9CELL|nr:hypothetical protein [Oerskovia turbata]RXR25799.1 hypothetical protein EQW73_09880 [Oerskovia turbata]RXR33365.1 hypothetical protein EQW78_11340 [Oerskovia turbata]